MDVATYSYVARWNSYSSLVELKTNLADFHFYKMTRENFCIQGSNMHTNSYFMIGS